MNNDEIKSELKSLSLGLGFCKFGVAKVEILDEEASNYSNWLENNYNAGMAWMDKNISKRRDIRLILPSAKSVIVLATNYFTDPKYNDSKIEFGKISRYAWGDDYHEIISTRLKEFRSKILELAPNSENKEYTDTGAILEKVWAERAGIGWQGKNSLLLTKEYGSYIFLSIIITSLELKPDQPHKEFCGKCTRCLMECPTKAIISPKVVDSRRCISYWTIEARNGEDIPNEIADNSNGYIFGCDICQEVCPWNNKAQITEDPRFHPRFDQTMLNRSEIIKMDEIEFFDRFRNSPIKRAKLNGMKRNCLNCK